MPDFTKTQDIRPRSLPAFLWLALAVVVIIFYFFGLTIPLLGPDEARYAQVAREMFDKGDWITPTLGGYNWFEKPALLYWLQIASYHAFGVNEFSARFGSALFGLGTIASLWFLGHSATKSQIANPQFRIATSYFPYWLTLITASTFGIMVFARGASFDIIITFPITAALVSFFIFDQSTERSFKKRYIPLISFYVFIGLALLAKGLIGIVFPFAIVGLFFLLSRRRPSSTFLASVFWGTFLSLAIAAIWYLPMYQRHGYEFINDFFIQHHFARFTSNKYQHPQPFYFFFWVLPLMTLPWLPFFFGALWRLAKSTVLHREIEMQREIHETKGMTFRRMGSAYELAPRKTLGVTGGSNLIAFASAWLLVPLIFFSFSGSKLPGYILPAVPAAIVLTSIYVSSLVILSRTWRNTILAIAITTFLVSTLLLVFVVPRFADSDSVKSLIASADERGYSANRVVGLHTISHNAEFYAAGRLVRDETGRQRRFSGNGELLEAMSAASLDQVIVLVPLEYRAELTQDARLKTEVLKDNGELAIAVVSPERPITVAPPGGAGPSPPPQSPARRRTRNR